MAINCKELGTCPPQVIYKLGISVISTKLHKKAKFTKWKAKKKEKKTPNKRNAL